MKNVILIVLISSVFFVSGCTEKFIGSEDKIFADKVFTDSATGLTWQTTDTKKDWEAAIAYCEELDYANHQDWHLPSIRALETIVVITNPGIAIDLVTFPQTKPSHYWSATTYEGRDGAAYAIDFSNGMTISDEKKAFELYVRCVRKRQ